jgi:hypothetical protein
MNQLKKEYIENGNKCCLFVDYGFSSFNKQEPYFSITSYLMIDDRKYNVTQDELIKHFPYIEKYLKWDLCFMDSGPIHYETNAMYHFEHYNKKYFNETVVFGAIEEKPLPCLKEEVREWLKNRKPLLIAQFKKEMIELGVL